MPQEHIAWPSSTVTIQRDLRELRKGGLIEAVHTTRNPETNRRFASGPRMVYTSQFNTLPTHNVPV